MKSIKYNLKASFYSLLFCFTLSCNTQKVTSKVNSASKLTSNSNELCNSNDQFSWNSKYAIINNQWGKSKVKKGEVDICLQPFSVFSDTLFGWTFTMPQKSYGVVAYPEVYFGTSPWSIEPIKENLIQFKNLKNLDLNYKALLQTDGKKMNLSMDIWLMEGHMAAQKNIRTEIMIWEYQDNFKPNGKKFATLNFSSGRYDLYVGKIVRKQAGLQWQYIAFKRGDNRTQGHIPIKEMLDYLVQQKLVSEEYYIAAIEMGTELSNANGSIYFTQYDLNLE